MDQPAGQGSRWKRQSDDIYTLKVDNGVLGVGYSNIAKIYFMSLISPDGDTNVNLCTNEGVLELNGAQPERLLQYAEIINDTPGLPKKIRAGLDNLLQSLQQERQRTING